MLFWVGAVVLVAARLALSADLSVHVVYSPHDDSLYVERAYHLLRGEAFGPYDSRVLAKYPGLSLWLAGTGVLGIPYVLSIDMLYIAAGLYMATALRSAGSGRWVALAALGLYVFNPITFGNEWIRVIREPLATGLFVLMLAAMTHILASLDTGRAPWAHLGVLAPVFAFALFVREDDRLLWLLLAIFGLALGWRFMWRNPRRPALGFLMATIVTPAVLGVAYESGLRGFVEHHYGGPIIHELSEGEYPRLLAAIRSIHSAKDNRMVMVTQEALSKLKREVPAFRPVIERLPPPGSRTFSCRIHGVCTEWSNGWMPFWIRDEAYRAGFTASLPEGQAYFRTIRTAIETLCEAGRFACRDKGKGLVPPMELRWTRAYVAEAWRNLKLALAPDPNTVTIRREEAVPPSVADMYRTVAGAKASATASEGRTEVLGDLRVAIAMPYQLLGVVLILAALAALFWRWWSSDRVPMGSVALMGSVFAIYSIGRVAALSYVAVYMGKFDPRMMYSTYAAAMMLALPVVAEAIEAARTSRRKEGHA